MMKNKNPPTHFPPCGWPEYSSVIKELLKMECYVAQPVPLVVFFYVYDCQVSSRDRASSVYSESSEINGRSHLREHFN